MANVSKDQLIYENSVSFPNNNYGAITPANLRNFNVDLIDSTVNQAGYTADSNSFDGRIDDLNSTYNQFTSSTNAYTQSNENRWAYLDSISGSWITEPETGSFALTNATNTFTANQVISGNLDLTGGITSSLLPNYVLIGNSSGRTIAVPTASLQGPAIGGATTGSNNFVGNQSINGNLTVSGSTLLSGSTTISGSTVINGNTTITGSLNVSSTFLAPLGQGKIWVGGADGKNSYTEPTASFVGTGSFNTFSQSVDTRLDNLEAFSTSLDLNFVNETEFATYTQSIDNKFGVLANQTASLFSFTASQEYINQTYSQFTSSIQSYTSSNDDKVNQLINKTGSYATTGSNSFVGAQTVSGSVLVSGSFTANTFVVGTSGTSGSFPVLFQSASTITKDNTDAIIYNPNTNTLLISQSNGFTQINNNGFTATTASANLIRLSTLTTTLVQNNVEGGVLGFSGNPSKIGPPSLASSTNPGILAQSGSSPTYYVPLEFQPSASFTDGRVTANRLFRAISGIELTGSLLQSGTHRITGGNLEVTGSTTINGNTTISGSFNVSGSSVLTGSIQGNVNTLTISSNTASIDFASANFFDLTLVSGSTTRIEATNKRRGQTSNLRVTQPSVGTGSIVFSTDFKFPSISPYTASIGTGSVDIVTFITFDTGSIYTATVKNLV